MPKVDVLAIIINCGWGQFHTCVHACMCDALLRLNSIYFLTFYSSVLEALGHVMCLNHTNLDIYVANHTNFDIQCG